MQAYVDMLLVSVGVSFEKFPLQVPNALRTSKGDIKDKSQKNHLECKVETRYLWGLLNPSIKIHACLGLVDSQPTWTQGFYASLASNTALLSTLCRRSGLR
jgi:hypothetical protein